MADPVIPVTPAVAPAVPVIPENWKDALPEDVRKLPTIAALKTVPDAITMLLAGQKMVGAGKVAIPGKDAGEAEWGAVHDALGRPKTADDYQIAAPKDLPPGFAIDDGLAKGFRETAHKLGLLPAQVQGLFGWFVGENAKAFAGQADAGAAQLAETNAALRKEWGFAYDRKLAVALKAVTAFGGADLVGLLNQTGLGNHPVIIKMMAKVGEKIGEDPILAGTPAAGEGAQTPLAAQEKILELQGDKEFRAAYTAKEHPGHAAALLRMQRLHEQAYPGQRVAAA
jgi:hypothetical protein